MASSSSSYSYSSSCSCSSFSSSSSSSSFSSSSSSSSASHPLQYDVFLNFRGKDTRRNFISHLCAALRQKDLQTFFDDDDLKRGEKIAQSLPQAIQNSTVAVLVFSKDYASSSWCLDELAEIIECLRSRGQIVIPVFYGIDPSHLRKQSHNVAEAFVKHEQDLNNAQKIPMWRDALTTAANLSGFNSKEFKNDHMLINKIVEDVLEKLNQSMTYDDFEHLVGMDSRMEEIKELFTINPFDIRILGIWGMSGVGKTTTAELIYHEMSHQFQGCCFLHDVRQNSEDGDIKTLQEELISKALGEENPEKIMFSGGLTPFLKSTLSRKKMLIVLDNVNDPLQLEFLIGNPCWFGSGSFILVTSRDKEAFGGRADFIYEVKPLNHVEALQLFSKSAFKQKYSIDDYVSLSNSIVKYAEGNPLALKVLGSALIGKNHNEWKSALNQLSKASNKDIRDVERSELWDVEDNYKVFVKNKEAKSVESIILDTSSQESDSGWVVQFRSKYMTAEEIESILIASTHSNDPYIDDYYHQASLAKRSGSRSKHHFCPSQLKELPSRCPNSSDQHSHVHVDALGKIPIPSIRCPLSLLEIDPSGCAGGSSEHIFERPLEQEPLIAARITIEDCLAVLLDVKDIDRFLRHKQPQDDGSYLRRKRKVLLEAVAASLHLVDPLGQSGKTVGLASKDDLVFLRLVSLPKGQKLISEFLKLLFPGSELTRIVCMAIFRHLRFLFGGISPDPGAAETTANLVKTVSTCVSVMDLHALGACLVAVVCSTEQPPFRPLGSPNGDGASVILKSLLEKATTLLNNPQAAANCNLNVALWRASFDEFFDLLTKYCLHKYDTVLRSFYAKTAYSTEDIDSEIYGAMKSEMPVELLRTCLPHTNDRQMELLRHFGQQRNPVS
ncbi:hypothetical protein K2173_004197 [Erythroxylum novogranatense]|uniref:TIR domain-containing protein n=1 Tax=Erythroxylum novogranatense TaxID=1862640 RepID=A0AAV8SXJ8_9ROSI|nr:hypothetical protein K2173_004197 [Erythroxylum novogranatense]